VRSRARSESARRPPPSGRRSDRSDLDAERLQRIDGGALIRNGFPSALDSLTAKSPTVTAGF